MTSKHLIDCHILTLPRFDERWLDQLREDLDGEPLNQHWMEGIDGDLGGARANGYTVGNAPFVTSQDPDDRVMHGVYAELLQALEQNPHAPFAWAGEKLVDVDLKELSLPANVHPHGYSPKSHVKRGDHVHGVKLYRRALVEPLLDGIRDAGLCCEFYLDFALAKPWDRYAPRPVHVPIIGRLWRQHEHNGHRKFRASDFDHAAKLLGFGSIAEIRDAV